MVSWGRVQSQPRTSKRNLAPSSSSTDKARQPAAAQSRRQTLTPAVEWPVCRAGGSGGGADHTQGRCPLPCRLGHGRLLPPRPVRTDQSVSCAHPDQLPSRPPPRPMLGAPHRTAPWAPGVRPREESAGSCLGHPALSRPWGFPSRRLLGDLRWALQCPARGALPLCGTSATVLTSPLPEASGALAGRGASPHTRLPRPPREPPAHAAGGKIRAGPWHLCLRPAPSTRPGRSRCSAHTCSVNHR